MKLSVEQANKLLKGLGVTAQVVEDDKADADVDIDAAITEYQEERTSEMRNTLEKEVSEQAEEKFGTKLRGTLASQMLRTFGLSGKKEFEGLTTNDQILAKAKEMYDAKNGATKQEWETERATLLKEHEAELEALQAKVTEAESGRVADNEAWQTKHDDHFINTDFISAINKAPKKSGDPVELADMARYRAGKDYNFKYNHDSKKTEAYTKDGKLVKDFDIANTVTQFLERQGLKATDTRDLPPSQIKNSNNYQAGTVTEPAGNKTAHSNFAGVFEEL